MQIIVTALPGIAALIALFFTYVSLNGQLRANSDQLQTTKSQLQITEQGQITDRYTAAITDLGSASVDVRLGGIYALQRIMRDSARDQPTVVAVLCAFVRDHAKVATATSAHPSASPHASAPSQVPNDIQAALTVVGTRNTTYDTYDGSPTVVVDFTGADLSGANLNGAHLTGADLTGADLSGALLGSALLGGATLSATNLSGAFLGSATLSAANLSGAFLNGANLNGANLNGANLTDANLTDANLTDANLGGADLTGAEGVAEIPGAR